MRANMRERERRSEEIRLDRQSLEGSIIQRLCSY